MILALNSWNRCTLKNKNRLFSRILMASLRVSRRTRILSRQIKPPKVCMTSKGPKLSSLLKWTCGERMALPLMKTKSRKKMIDTDITIITSILIFTVSLHQVYYSLSFLMLTFNKFWLDIRVLNQFYQNLFCFKIDFILAYNFLYYAQYSLIFGI